MALAHWEDKGDPWDRLQLGTHVMPGVWEVTSGECARQVDHKKTKDKDGAHIKDLGVLPSRFSARGRMIEPADWEALQFMMPDINPKKRGGLRFPLTIFHPAVALLGVTTIYVERVRVPEIKDGILEISIDMIEWTAEPKKTKVSDRVSAVAASINEEKALIAQANQNWALRIAGIGNNESTAQTPSQAGGGQNDQFTRLPPGFTTTDQIDPVHPGDTIFGIPGI